MTTDYTREIEVHFTESLSANCRVKYSGWQGTPQTRWDPGEPPGLEVTAVEVLQVFVWLPEIGDHEITLTQELLDKLSTYATNSGSICQYIEETIMEGDE